MKTLLIMRHAKSSWKDTKLKDRERPLNKRGKKNAKQMGDLLKEKELCPQLILGSPALRARQTAEAVAANCGYTGEISFKDGLYMAEAEDVIKILRKLEDNLERVIVIGHNPGLESLLPLLSHQILSLPTGSIAYLSLPISTWKELDKDTDAELIELWKPKELEVSD
jgi:phosphohistidine phosphatase